VKKKGNLRKFDLTVSSQEIQKIYEDTSRQILKNIKDQLLLDEIVGNKEAIESWKAGCEVTVSAFRVSAQGLILAECNRWKHPPAQGGNLARFHYTIKYSHESDEIIVTSVGLQDSANMITKAEKITEVKIDFTPSNENFIAGMISRVLAKVKDRIAIRNNLRIV
jgi:hypothetical protein